MTGTGTTATGIARAAVLGMVSGAVGTVAMTLSERLEMSLSGRAPSTVPGQVGAHLLPGADPGAPSDVARLNGPVHWGHGIAMGALRGVLDVAGLHGPAATAAHFALVWGGDAALYKGLGLAPWPWQWKRSELATDLFGKTVLASATSLFYVAFERK